MEIVRISKDHFNSSVEVYVAHVTVIIIRKISFEFLIGQVY